MRSKSDATIVAYSPQEANKARIQMETLAASIKSLVLQVDPLQLISRVHGELMMLGMWVDGSEDEKDLDELADAEAHRNIIFMALEYIHAVLSCFQPVENLASVDDGHTAALLQAVKDLAEVTSHYCVVSSSDEEGIFGVNSRLVEVQAKTDWVNVRGSRYPVLEEEFFNYALQPHNEALLATYGVGATEIASGINRVVYSMSGGHANATNVMLDVMAAYAAESPADTDDEKAVEKFLQRRGLTESLSRAGDDLLRGGTANVTRNSQLPAALLDDLSWSRGENQEFYKPGDFCGTPMLVMPGRVKPLIKIDDQHYAVDFMFCRDTAYRAIQRALKSRRPSYKAEWEERQRHLSEAAFPTLLSQQLRGATVLQSFYYRDIDSGNWVENDTLIVLDDVLVQIESKAGVMPMSSPATRFNVHARSIQRLILEAYEQASRFLRYAASQEVVPIYVRVEDRYREMYRLRLGDFRVVLPIGMTMESYTPISSMCKRLDEIKPILGRHPFISMSVDDLPILNRFFPTSGAFFHYLEVRQQAAGFRELFLYDEVDHIGAYVNHNRFDLKLREQLRSTEVEVISLQSAAGIVDEYFRLSDWGSRPVPTQRCPLRLIELMNALDGTRERGWLRGQSMLWEYGAPRREQLANLLDQGIESIGRELRSTVAAIFDVPLMLQFRRKGMPEGDDALAKARTVAVKACVPAIDLLLIEIDQSHICSARYLQVTAPEMGSADWTHARDHANAMAVYESKGRTVGRISLKPHEPCWCGSGQKYRKCHRNSDLA